VFGGARDSRCKIILFSVLTIIQLISKLQEGASDFIKDMLDIVLNNMLVVELKKTSELIRVAKPEPEAKRITAIDLAKKLEVMKNKNDRYFTDPGAKSSATAPKLPQTLTLKEPAADIIIKKRSATRTFP